MAEALGIVTGVIGLLPICANGYFFIEGICEAHAGVEAQMVRIQLQRRDLDAWGHVWEIPPTLPKWEHDFKFKRWIERNPSQATNVLDTLSDLSNFFADVSNLERSYGIVLKKQDPALRDMSVKTLLSNRKDVGFICKDVERRRQHMNIVNRCHFQLKGAKEFDQLILRLREFIQSLRNICSEHQADQIDRAISKAVSANKNPASLEMISRVYEEEANTRRNAGQRSQGAELIRDIAAFKAQVQKLHEKRKELTSKRQKSGKHKAFLLSGAFYDEQRFWYPPDILPSLNTPVRLATDTDACKSRYIEFKNYADSEGQPDLAIEGDILELSDFFRVPNRPQAFRVMDCLGIFREERQGRFGFVYQPPPYIENIANNRTIKGQMAQLRVPKSLLDLLRRGIERGGSSGILPLGQRFYLARALAQSLYVLHATGWVHKNIRSSSVVLVPAESRVGGIPSTTGLMNLANPYLCGFGHSRPADRRSEYSQKSHNFWNITIDEYQHPAKQEDASRPYIQAFDLYSLGTVLLELGLWQPLSLIPHDGLTSSDFRLELMKMAREELPGQVGQIYANVVLECLAASRVYSDAQTQDVLCWKVAAALDECKA